MTCWRINTDQISIRGFLASKIWYEEGRAFTGSDPNKKGKKYYSVFEKMRGNDTNTIFMHQTRVGNVPGGIVGYGIVTENEWDGKHNKGADRLLYKDDGIEEYSISVKWKDKYNRTSNPLPIYGLLPFMGYFSYVDPRKWDIEGVLEKLRK